MNPLQTTAPRVVLSSREVVQIHTFLTSRAKEFTETPRTYDEYRDIIKAAFGISPSDHTIRRCLQGAGLRVKPKWDTETRRAVAKRLITEGKLLPNGAPGFRGGYGVRKLTEDQIQQIEQQAALAQQHGFRLDRKALQAEYKISGSVLGRVLLGTYRLPGGGSQVTNPGSRGGTSYPTQRRMQIRDSQGATTQPPNGERHTAGPVETKLDALTKAQATDREITLRLLQENGVLAGLLRGVISGIEGLYTGLGVPPLQQPKPQETQQTQQTQQTHQTRQ